MYSHIMVPVDLVHKDKLEKAIDVAGDLARHYSAPVHVVTVTGDVPGPLGHTPAQKTEALNVFAAELREKHGVDVKAHSVASNDPAVDTTRRLLEAIDDIGADLVIMASHQPGVMEHIFNSHGGYIARHARCSVFVVR